MSVTIIGPVIDQYPRTKPLVRGDPVTIPVTFGVDITGWTWRAQIRRTPDASDVIDEFTISADVDDPTHTIVLSLTSTQSIDLEDGCGWDLQSVTPAVRTWVLCKYLRVQKDYSHD